MKDSQTAAAGLELRDLVRGQGAAALAVTLDDGAPYAALVLGACDQAGRPLLLISDLAEHTKALRRRPRAGLLYDGTDPKSPARLAGTRATLLGTLAPADDVRLKERFLRRQPEAQAYRDFADFSLWRMAVERVHLVAGFGRIGWLDGAAYAGPQAEALAEAEAGIIAHMNADHREAVADYAVLLGGAAPGDWVMTGIDPEGIDLGGPGRVRIGFPELVADAAAARAVLAALARAARQNDT